MISLIVAVNKAHQIGSSRTNSLLWKLPEDLGYFKAKTSGKTVIMGANTFNSLPFKLPNRKNVVISSGKTELKFKCDAQYRTLGHAFEEAYDDIAVIGGGEIYKKCMSVFQPDELLITQVFLDGSEDGDIVFPQPDAGRIGDISIAYKNENTGLVTPYSLKSIPVQIEQSSSSNPPDIYFTFLEYTKC